jgi:DNA replication protein DnaC
MPSDDEILTELVGDLERRRSSEKAAYSEKTSVKTGGEIVRSITPEDRCRQNEERLAVIEKQERQQRKADNWASYIQARGRRYADCTLENFECPTQAHTDRLDKLKGYAEQMAENFADGRGVWLFGPCGTGKDHLSSALCRIAIWRFGKRVRWVDGMRLFADLRDSFDNNKTSEASLVDGYAKCDVLAISDPLPPMGDMRDYMTSLLFRIIDTRYSAMLPTIITANVTKDDSDKRFGAPIVDRLRHSSLTLNCNWESYRKQRT